ncbi:hypothetical protein Psfp_00629 [Pelotomaculum sp. FP]|uniref:hypothetical protein n=1 Tax=Pelotomaculum sp. FP TaxID=261474 RepID=UPI0010647361|nr:hypothetical protein [Pelotomaculum sp. FP]TEB17405.1 hypothetical protein Psfp_00629 [Pelotomaculum sp. FP]
MAMLTFWSNLFFSLKVYIVYNYIVWLIQEKVLQDTVTLLLPLLFPVFSVQVAIQLIKNFVYRMASFGVLIGPY